MWPIEARNAAIANSYFVGSINRVGTEIFPNPFTSGDGKPQHADLGTFMDPAILLKDKWGFRMTARYEMYAELLANYLKPDFEPQVISDPCCIRRLL
ncbi:hypothetical protein SLA2020_264280 [Shorea laevis]